MKIKNHLEEVIFQKVTQRLVVRNVPPGVVVEIQQCKQQD